MPASSRWIGWQLLAEEASRPNFLAMDAIRVEALTKRYGETLAVDAISFAVPRGTTVGLLGGNGAGKTTTLRAVSRLLKGERGEVTKGNIEYKGERIEKLTPSDLVSPWFSHLPRWELTAKLKMFFSEEVRQGIGTSHAMERLDRALPPSFASWLPFNQAEYLEATMLLPGYILSSQGDRMAMAHSVEARHPFLDHRVVDFAAKLPPNLKMKVLDQKHLLKQAASGLIPASIQKRVKQPYRAPDGQALLGQGWDYVKEYLSPERLRRDGIFHPAAVAALVAKFATGRAHSTKDNMAAVAIVSTGLLIDQFIHPHPGSSLWHPQLLEKCTTSS